MKNPLSFKIEVSVASLRWVTAFLLQPPGAGSAHAATHGVGLVWRGVGACNDGCGQAAGKMDRMRLMPLR
ncbi:MAG: hypothetical protein H7222_16855 [Methylotenera sp.]|nr:hypothetical protein [Oligoflexia bacterium]